MAGWPQCFRLEDQVKAPKHVETGNWHLESLLHDECQFVHTDADIHLSSLLKFDNLNTGWSCETSTRLVSQTRR